MHRCCNISPPARRPKLKKKTITGCVSVHITHDCDLLPGVEVVEGGMKKKRKRRTSVEIHQREG